MNTPLNQWRGPSHVEGGGDDTLREQAQDRYEADLRFYIQKLSNAWVRGEWHMPVDAGDPRPLVDIASEHICNAGSFPFVDLMCCMQPGGGGIFADKVVQRIATEWADYMVNR